MNNCACASHDATECIRLRYPCEMTVEEPCECVCHKEGALDPDYDYPTYEDYQ